MKVIIAGGREFNDSRIFVDALQTCPFFEEITEVVSGGARGVDRYGEDFSRVYLQKEPKIFKADWDQYDNSAGPIRNREMANYADALLAIWDGKSKGTKDMIEVARKQGLQVSIYKY